MPAGTSHTYIATLGTIWSLMLKGKAAVPLCLFDFSIALAQILQILKKFGPVVIVS